jgi:hypothetical protein
MTSGDLVAAKVGNGLDLDGTNDALTIADSATTSITGALTASLWFKMTNNPAAQNEGLITKWQGAGGYTNQRTFNLGVTTNGYVYGFVSSTGSSATASTTGSTDRADGAWHHVALVYVPSTSVTVYRNGVQESQTTSSVPASLYDASSPLAIGNQFRLDSPDGADFFAVAVVDEARLAATARSASWLLAEFNNQNDPSSFYAVGGEVGSGGTRRRVTVVN